MGLDMNDFIEYSKNFKNLKKEFKAWLKGWMLKQGNQLIAATKARTPIDTGNLRNSWYLKNDVQIQGNMASINFGNSAEYASIIEYGTPKRPSWKWANGAHMMTISMAELEQRMPDAFDRAFEQFLKEKGII